MNIIVAIPPELALMNDTGLWCLYHLVCVCFKLVPVFVVDVEREAGADSPAVSLVPSWSVVAATWPPGHTSSFTAAANPLSLPLPR